MDVSVNSKNEDKKQFSKFKNFTNAVKDKLTTLFKKKVKIPIEIKSTTNEKEKKFDRIPAELENKPIFKIEEDEEGKEYSYNLKDETDSDEEDEEEDEPEEPEKINKEKENISNKPSYSADDNDTAAEIQKENISNEEINYETFDNQSISHRIYNKGIYLDLNEVFPIKLTKQKNKKNIFSFIGLGKKVISREYMMFLDENYIYFMKDVEVCKENRNLRKLGNRYNIKLLQNLIIDRIDNKSSITLEFLKDINSEDTVGKFFILDDKHAEVFLNLLNIYFKRLNINFFDDTIEDNN